MDETQITALKEGAAVLYQTLQNVAALHDLENYTAEDGEEYEVCQHCSGITEKLIVYPCPTVRVLLSDFEPENEETLAE